MKRQREATVQQAFIEVAVQKAIGPVLAPRPDELAVEEPLEIRLGYSDAGRRVQRSISITMRTPGEDAELAAGFLLSEGMIHSPRDILSIAPCGPAVGPLKLHNVIRVELHADIAVDVKRLERHFYTTSSCGVCGKTALEALQINSTADFSLAEPIVSVDTIHRLPLKLREAQAVFSHTGGLHGAGLFNADGVLLGLREDVGRHNAVDKLIGSELLAGRLPLTDKVIMVSGRASFELMQKALMAGIPMLVAVGAPSSLAVELARRFKMTLIGFARDGQFNVYNGEQRLRAVL
jgi:FdhD protein